MNGQLVTSVNIREKKLLKVRAKVVEFIYGLSSDTCFKNVPYLVVLFKDNLLFLLLEHLRNYLGT